jgi:hypothetical protein
MIMSVSTLIMRNGAATPSKVREFFHGFVPYFTPETSYLQGRV